MLLNWYGSTEKCQPPSWRQKALFLTGKNLQRTLLISSLTAQYRTVDVESVLSKMLCRILGGANVELRYSMNLTVSSSEIGLAKEKRQMGIFGRKLLSATSCFRARSSSRAFRPYSLFDYALASPVIN